MAEETPFPMPPTPEELAAADDETAEALITTYVEERLQHSGVNQFKEFKSLPVGMQYVTSTLYLELDVDNGGFNQYFFNVTSDYSLEALAGYRRFKATEHAKLVRKAIAIYHRERWLHIRAQLRRSLEAYFEATERSELRDIDSQFYDLTEDATTLRGAYIREHLEEFRV